MIPEQRKATPVGGSILSPDRRNAVPLIEDYETGGTALSDSSQGFLVRDWKAEVINGSEIWLSPEDTPGDAVLVRTDTNITEVTFSFDQLMREVVAYVADGVAYIWYFDSEQSQFDVKSIPDAISPFATLDDKRRIGGFLGENDVLIFYIKNSNVYYRAQRDRYDVEYLFSNNIPGAAQRISKCGMDNQYRMHIEIQLREMGN